jgi:hypothetical protein
VFDGNAQVLDHALANPALRPWVSGFAYARSNADFPESLRGDAARPERLSDHDASIVYLALGSPRLSGRVVGKNPDVVDLQLTNTGGGNARRLVIDQFYFRTLAGAAAVTSDAVLPLDLGDLAPGQTITVRLPWNVPPGVTRFAMTVGGTLVDAAGGAFRYSISQAIIP